MRGQCQICGRLHPIMKDGGLATHYRHGNLCLGVYSPPVTESFDAIPAAIEHWTEQDNRCARKFGADVARRSNEPLPASFWQSWHYAARERSRLIGRLKRLTATPVPE